MTVSHVTLPILLVLCLSTLTGCGPGPSKANIELRKKNQELQDDVTKAKRERDAARAEVTGLRASMPTVPTLAPDKLAKLFTVNDIEIGRLTSGAESDRHKSGDDGLKVYVTPTDASGQKLKAAGSFVIEAFDLALPSDQRVGHWEFDVSKAPALWNGTLARYEYVLPCPFDKPVAHSDLTLKITFTDELTSRVFTKQQVVKVAVATP